MTNDELLRDIDQWLDELRSDMQTYDENAAIHAPDDGRTTNERAMLALARPERFEGEHQVAQMWIYTSDTARLWTRKNGTE